MGAILLLSLLPMALAFGLFDGGNDDDTPETNDEELPGEKMQVIEDEPLTGTAGSDTITGTDEADTVSGGAGDDNIYLGAGDDMGDEEDLDALIDSVLAAEPSEVEGDLTEAGIWGADGGAGDDYIDTGHGNDAATGGDGYDSYAIAWDKGDAPVVITDFWAEQTVEETAGGTLTTTIIEGLTIETDSWSDDQTFTVEQSGDDVNVSIDGDLVATLQGVDATLVASSVNLYNSADGSFIDATLIQN